MSSEKVINNSTKQVLFIAHDDKFIKHFLVDHKEVFEKLHYKVVYATNNKYGSFDNDKDTVVYDIAIEQSPFKFIKNFKALMQIRQYIKEENVEVIYAHTPVGGVVGRLAKLFNSKINVIYLPHGYHFLKGSSLSSWLIYFPVEKVLSYLTNLTITINREDYFLTRKRFNKKLSVELINGVGVNVNHTKQCKAVAGSNDFFNITHVAELNDNKNQMCLLEAVKIIKDKSIIDSNIPNFKVYFIGEGKNLEELKQFVDDNDLNHHVSFLGYINNVEDYLSISNCAISCSKREGLPVNLIESLSFGIPIVATNCRGNRDVVQNGINGYLTKFNDHNELALQIISLMFESKEFIDSFYENNIMKSKIYSTEIVNLQLENIFREQIIGNY